MDETFIELGASVGGLGSKFVSVHPEQDSLFFYSKKATYSLQDYIIKAREVDQIEVADAVIFPANKSVRVEKYAKMNRLYKSSLKVKNEQNTIYMMPTSVFLVKIATLVMLLHAFWGGALMSKSLCLTPCM